MKKRLSAIIIALAMLVSIAPCCLAAEDETVYEHVFPQWYNKNFPVCIPVPEEYDMENEEDAAAFEEWISSLCTKNEDGSVTYRLDKETHEAWLETGKLWIDHMIDRNLSELPARIEVSEDYSSFDIITNDMLAPVDRLLNSFSGYPGSIAQTVVPLLCIDPAQVTIRCIEGPTGTVTDEKSLLEHIEQYNQTFAQLGFSDALLDSQGMSTLVHFEEWLTTQGYGDVKTVLPPHMGFDTTADPNRASSPEDFTVSEELANNVFESMEMLGLLG